MDNYKSRFVLWVHSYWNRRNDFNNDGHPSDGLFCFLVLFERKNNMEKYCCGGDNCLLYNLYTNMIIDVHAHLDFVREAKVKKIQEDPNIKLVVSNSVNLSSCKKNLELSNKYSKVKLAVGLYPEKELQGSDFAPFLSFIRQNKDKIISIGEIGLDLYHTKENFEVQKKLFIKQLDLAKELKIPVIVHTRKAEKESLKILEGYKDLNVILHCFSGNFKLVKMAEKMGCYFSIPTNIVRSEHFQRIIEEIPRNKILTETDSPYLSPFKEKENEPAFIAETIKKMSEIWKISKKEVEKIIEENCKNLFKE